MTSTPGERTTAAADDCRVRPRNQSFVSIVVEFELLINLKTAKALGLKVPVSMQLLADEGDRITAFCNAVQNVCIWQVKQTLVGDAAMSAFDP